MKVLKVFKSEQKKDKKGNNFQSIRANVLYLGSEMTAFINSYEGNIGPGAEIDDSLAEQKTGEKGAYLSVFLSKSKKDEPQKYSPAPEPAPKIEAKQYTPEELEQLMTKCLEYFGRQKELLEAFGVPKESVTFIIGSLFNSMKERGIRPNDWKAVIKPATDIDGGFANPGELERQRMIQEIKEAQDSGKITPSALRSTIDLNAGKEVKLPDCTLEQVRTIYSKIIPKDGF